MSRLEQMLGFLESDPHDPFTRYAVALELNSVGRPEEALDHLEKLRAEAPGYLPTYYQLGALLRAADRAADAQAAYEQGCAVARSAGDTHTLAELQAALDELDAPDW